MVVTLECRKKVLEEIGCDSNTFGFNFFSPFTPMSKEAFCIEIVRKRNYSNNLKDKDLGGIPKEFAEKIAKKYSLDLGQDLRFYKTIREDCYFKESFESLNSAEKEFIGKLEFLLEYINKISD